MRREGGDQVGEAGVSESPASWKVGSTPSAVRAGGGQGRRVSHPAVTQVSFGLTRTTQGPPLFSSGRRRERCSPGTVFPQESKRGGPSVKCFPQAPGAARMRPREVAGVTVIELSLLLSLRGAAVDRWSLLGRRSPHCQHGVRAEGEWLLPAAPGGWTRPRPPGERLSAQRPPRCPQSSRRPPEGALASPVAGLPLSGALPWAASTIFFSPITRVIACVLYEILSPKANSVGRCGTSSLFQQLGPWGSRPRTSAWLRGAVPWADPPPDGRPCRREPGPWWVPRRSPNRPARAGGIGGGGSGHRHCCCSEGRPTCLPPLPPVESPLPT